MITFPALHRLDKRARSISLLSRSLPLVAGFALSLWPAGNLRAQSPVPANRPPQYPAWWFQRNVIERLSPENTQPNYARSGDYLPPNDFALLTEGQLKNLALTAYQEFAQKMTVNAEMIALLQPWLQTNPVTHAFLLDSSNHYIELVGPTTLDNAPANLGQLKAVAMPFYKYLINVGAIPDYPWYNSPDDPDDFALATLGQAKELFSFDLTQLTAGFNGLPNTWLIYYGLDPANGGGPNDNPAKDGLTNIEKFAIGLDPTKKDNPILELSAFGFATP